jgi:Putative zinc-finger
MFPEQPPAVIEMHCKEVRRLIVQYLDGELELEALVRVDAHLEHCDHCKAIYDGARNIVLLLGSEKIFELPKGLSDRLYERLIEPEG